MSRRIELQVKHNVEMGHRLSLQPDSKCFHLHGHSWWVTLSMCGTVRPDGMLIDFAKMKAELRGYLDNLFDHHLCLNKNDPLVTLLHVQGSCKPGEVLMREWGIYTIECDPTVENMARIWGEHMRNVFGHDYGYRMEVWEASTNCAIWEG